MSNQDDSPGDMPAFTRDEYEKKSGRRFTHDFPPLSPRQDNNSPATDMSVSMEFEKVEAIDAEGMNEEAGTSSAPAKPLDAPSKKSPKRSPRGRKPKAPKQTDANPTALADVNRVESGSEPPTPTQNVRAAASPATNAPQAGQTPGASWVADFSDFKVSPERVKELLDTEEEYKKLQEQQQRRLAGDKTVADVISRKDNEIESLRKHNADLKADKARAIAHGEDIEKNGWKESAGVGVIGTLVGLVVGYLFGRRR
eukprot:GFYU01002710.1.p1 GENE.GFYU01002710.1~~GFYU01002710.1.p1  ORF type:complete len:255 (-),score=54.27 GFYU01002710.1:457-1221(-)